MTLKINNCVSDSCRVGFQIETGSGDATDIELNNSRSINCGIGTLVIQPKSLLAQIGLPENADPREVIEILRILRSVPVEARAAEISKIGLFQKVMQIAIDSSSFTSNMITIAGSSQYAAVVASLTALAGGAF